MRRWFGRRQPRIVDPRNPRPRLKDPGRLDDDGLAPRDIRPHSKARPVPLRILGFGGFLVLAFGALGYNLFSLQVQQGAQYAELAEGNRIRQETVLAPRGIIFDRHGKQLVVNAGSFAASMVPIDLPRGAAERTKELVLLGRLLGLSPEEIDRQASAHAAEPFQPVVLKRNLDNATYEALSENEPNLPGIRLTTELSRHYIEGAAMSHVLGYVGKLDPDEYRDLHDKGYLLDDQVGKSGLEYADEQWLRGTSGQQVVETDAQGQIKARLQTTDPVPGDNVYLSVDIDLQREVVTQLQAGMDAAHKKQGGNLGLSGAAVVMNPQTGEVYSMVSLPDYNVNEFAEGITTQQYQALVDDRRLPLLDRAIGGLYPPGSTFKPVTASAALTAGTINQGSSINCPGRLVRGTTTFLCWNTGGHGSQNVVQAIAHSCDVFFYTVADQMGDQVLSKFASDFGVGRQTGIDIGGEVKGIVPNSDWKKRYFDEAFKETGDPAWQDSTWYEGNTITYGIGQSYLLTTPLQVLQWTSTVANGGHFLKPQLNNRITGIDGADVRPFAPVLDHDVQAPGQVLAIVREGLREAAQTGGTSGFVWNQAAFKNVPSPAGKTGTAQYGLPDAKGNFPTHAWYTAYAPAVDPEVAVVVFIEGGGEGSDVSAPTTARIMSYYFAHRDEIRATGPNPALAAGG
ncbi:MAG: penicillin-binding protein 2 [Chloroflexota bacterium]|nr:penicillin-binding protein 2 [Chloroflexota bacterium]